RQWDFYYIMTKKTIKRASADVGLVFCAFNLRRIFNIIDRETLMKYLKALFSVFSLIPGYFKPPSAFSGGDLPPIFLLSTCRLKTLGVN
ncbi:MAG: hypothetical protein ACK5NK_04310, partial [Niabella sp.]